MAAGLIGFREIEVLTRRGRPEILPAEAVAALWPEAGIVLSRLTAPRATLGLALDRPRVMAVVNVTPDSFSDGGLYRTADAAVAHGMELVQAGADLLDVGGESTRPGSEGTELAEESDRLLPVIEGLVAAGCPVPISVDTRKAAVMRAALAAGARMVNDVSALTYDPEGPGAATAAEAVCLMHAQGEPRTMQENPVYTDVLLDVYDFLAERIAAAEAAGIAREAIVIDPGIGFGKTLDHNLTVIRRLSLLHGLGCPVLLGVSRKGFIGRLSGEQAPERRAAGSIAAGLAGLGQGVQMLRAHDVAQTVQAVRVWRALEEGEAA